MSAGEPGVAAMRVVELALAGGARAGVVDRVGRKSLGHELESCRGRQIETPGSLVARYRGRREAACDFGADDVTAAADTRSDVHPNALGPRSARGQERAQGGARR